MLYWDISICLKSHNHLGGCNWARGLLASIFFGGSIEGQFSE